MIKELQQFETMDVPEDRCDVYLGKIRKECNDRVTELHILCCGCSWC